MRETRFSAHVSALGEAGKSNPAMWLNVLACAVPLKHALLPGDYYQRPLPVQRLSLFVMKGLKK